MPFMFGKCLSQLLFSEYLKDGHFDIIFSAFQTHSQSPVYDIIQLARELSLSMAFPLLSPHWKDCQQPQA